MKKPLWPLIKAILARLFFCHILQSHAWTCAFMEGVAATPEQFRGGVKGFKSYATTYCRRCKVENRSSKEWREGNG